MKINKRNTKKKREKKGNKKISYNKLCRTCINYFIIKSYTIITQRLNQKKKKRIYIIKTNKKTQ